MRANLLPGTLDLLVLKAASLGQEHGYGLLLRIQKASRDTLLIEQGALYPALFRLETQGLIESEWGTSDNNRRAKYYSLTRAGRARRRQKLGAQRAQIVRDFLPHTFMRGSIELQPVPTIDDAGGVHDFLPGTAGFQPALL